MRAKLKRFHSPDVFDLYDYRPADEDEFAFLLQLMVGPLDSEGEESFDVVICTPQWLQAQVAELGPMALRHHLVVPNYNFAEISTFLRREVESCQGENWSEVAIQVGRIGQWEFEDYKEFPASNQH